MSILDSLAVHWRAPDGRPANEIEADIRDELNFHLEMLVEEEQRTGMSAEAAQRAARVRFGDLEQIQSACRRIHLGERILLQRVQVGLLVVLVLGLSIVGAAIFRRQSAQEQSLAALHDSVESVQAGLLQTLESAPPFVVRTVPARGEQAVDPGITEIRATFSKPMAPDSWSWVQGDGAYPAGAGDIRFLDDGQTCVFPVKLEPGTEYMLGLNSEKHQNFRDTYGRSATPYVLFFKTADLP